MTQTPNLALPYIAPGQALKHITLNEALRRLDALIHMSVISHELTAPPLSPGNEDRYLVPVGASGIWTDRTGDIAVFRDGEWDFITPLEGWTIWSKTNNQFHVWDGNHWIPLSMISPTEQTEFLGINSVADTQNRLSISSPGSLFYASSDSHRLAISKHSEIDTASLVLQNQFVGHSEIGLTGTNDLTVKVSPDGADWKDAIRVDKLTGYVGFNTAPDERLTVSDGAVRLGYNLYNANENLNSPAFELMQNAAGHRNAYFDMHACDEFSNYSTRIIRFAGPNSPLKILNRGVGGVTISTEDAGPVKLETQNTTRLFVKSDGRVGVGTMNPSAKLDVNGTIRVGQYASQNLPDAAVEGEGAIIFVTDAPVGPGLRVSNGANWIV